MVWPIPNFKLKFLRYKTVRAEHFLGALNFYDPEILQNT